MSAASPEALRSDYVFDFWFQGDTPRIVENLSDPSSNYYRISLHPIFAALFLPIGLALEQIGASAWDAARIVTALGAAVPTALPDGLPPDRRAMTRRTPRHAGAARLMC